MIDHLVHNPSNLLSRINSHLLSLSQGFSALRILDEHEFVDEVVVVGAGVGHGKVRTERKGTLGDRACHLVVVI